MPEFSAPGAASRREVYDLTIEGEHEYFANGILVHNCSDTLDYFYTSAFKEQWQRFHKKETGPPPVLIVNRPRANSY